MQTSPSLRWYHLLWVARGAWRFDGAAARRLELVLARRCRGRGLAVAGVAVAGARVHLVVALESRSQAARVVAGCQAAFGAALFPPAAAGPPVAPLLWTGLFYCASVPAGRLATFRAWLRLERGGT